MRISRIVYLIMFIGISIVSVNIAFATSLGVPPVGIGTSSPQSSLHIVDSGVSAIRLEETSGNKLWIFANDKTNFNNAFTIWNPSAGTTVLIDYNTGNVGIGTSTPQSPLHIKSTGVSAIRLEETSGNKLWIFANDKTNFNNAFTIWNPTAGATVLIDYNTGNVGIGTSTPGQKLDVVGNIRLTGNIISSNDICIGTC